MARSRTSILRLFDVRAHVGHRISLGSESIFNLSVYAFGMAGVWIALGSVVLQFKILDVIENESIAIFGLALDKNSLLALISLAGLGVVAVVQPLAGLVSDNVNSKSDSGSKRLPFVVVGLMGMCASTLMLGFVSSFIMVLVVTLLIQLTGNIAQGPANALIIDHVNASDRGRASGMLNLMRLLGAGFVGVAVTQLMSLYDPIDAPHWMWYAIVVMTGTLFATSVYTLLALRTQPSRVARAQSAAADATHTIHDETQTQRVNRKLFYGFLAATAVMLASQSSIQINALFFLQDVVGLENPAQGANIIIIAIVIGAAATVYPAGKLSDRVGRGAILLTGGIIGAIGMAMLLVFNTLALLVVPAVTIGMSVGLNLAVGLALANDLVRQTTAARDLGMLGISSLVGAIVGRTSGFGIGVLNSRGQEIGIDFLGYNLLIALASISLFLAGLMLFAIVRMR